MAKYMTQSEYGQHRGCSQQRVSAMIRSGKIPKDCLKRISGRRLIDCDMADAALADNLDRIYNPVHKSDKSNPEGQSSVPPTNPPKDAVIKKAGMAGMTITEAQRIQAQYKAALLKLEYEEKKGELISKEQAENDFFNIARRFRDAVMNIPDRIGAEIASINDVHLVTDKLRAEITETLTELSKP